MKIEHKNNIIRQRSRLYGLRLNVFRISFGSSHIVLFGFVAAMLPVVSFAQTIHGIAAGNHHNLAICSGGGSLHAWGYNFWGQLGDNTNTNRSTAVTVTSLSGACWTPTPPLHFIDIACGDNFSMALSDVGTDAGCGSLPGGIVFAWGNNGYGQIGDGGTIDRWRAKRVAGSLQGLTAIAIAAGGSHALALISGGTSMKAWGRNDFGQCGLNNTTSPQLSPQSVVLTALGGRTITKISAGSHHSLVLCSDGTVWAWGYNANGQLGDGTTTNSSIPVSVNLTALGARTVTAISGIGLHSLAMCSDGTVWAWGNNLKGELGDGTSGTDRLTPVQVVTGASGCATYLCGITAIGTGTGFPNTSIALKSDGTVWTWGFDNLGMLGSTAVADEANALSPVQMTGMTSINAVAVGGQHTLISKGNGTVWISGDGLEGQVGNAASLSVSVGTQGTTVCTNILPVEMLSFTGKRSPGNVSLNWSTASEINNDYFSIERSTDGNEFFPIGTIPGSGTSSAIRKYDLVDENPFSDQSPTPPPFLYYRLKQVDFDGRSEYFGPVAVPITPSSGWELNLQGFASGNILAGSLIVNEKTSGTLEVFDLHGRSLRKESFIADPGGNYLKVDVEGLAPGTYIVHIYDRFNRIVRKFSRL